MTSSSVGPQPHENGDPTADFEPQDLTGLFGTPSWLRDLGTSAWLAVGLTLFVVAVIWILALTQTIVAPVTTAAVVAAVASPLIGWLERRRLARGLGAALLLVAFIVLVVAVVSIVVGGITGQADELRTQLTSAKDTLAGWSTDLGVDPQAADTAKDDASSAVSGAVPALLDGVAAGVKRLSSLVFFLGLTAL